MRHLLLSVALLAAATSVCAQQTAPPEPASPITDRFALRASVFFGTAATNGRVDDAAAAPTLGTPFSLEKDFKLSPKVHQARAEFIFRLRERGRLRVDLWELTRTGVASPTGTVVYGGHTFTPADIVHSEFDWHQVDLTWTYSFLKGRRFELGAGLGLHLLEAEANAEATQSTGPVTEKFSGAGPFVTVAIDSTWRITRRFALSARAQYFKLTVNSVKGQLADYHGDLQFRWRPNLAFGLGYQSTQTQL
ncbi:MAG: hypothetical protein ACRES2_01765, partial [Steroidobacteraceae bacterium]